MARSPAQARLTFYLAVFAVGLVSAGAFVGLQYKEQFSASADPAKTSSDLTKSTGGKNTATDQMSTKSTESGKTSADLTKSAASNTATPAASAGGSSGATADSSSLLLEQPEGLPDTFASANTALPRLWNIGIIVASIAFLALLLVGGLQYLTSAGNEEQSKKARTLLLDAVIGLVIVVIAWPLGKWVLSQLGQGGLFANPEGETRLESAPIGTSGLSSSPVGNSSLRSGSQTTPGTSEDPNNEATQETPGVSEEGGTFDEEFEASQEGSGSSEGDGEGTGDGDQSASNADRFTLTMAFRDINSTGTPLANYGYSVVSGTDPYDVLSSGQSDAAGAASLIFPAASAGQTVRVVAAAGVSGSEVSTLYGPFTLPSRTGEGITVFAHPENDTDRVTAYFRVVSGGEKISGASVVVFDAGGKQLGKGSTNSYGLAAVTVPAAATTSVKVTYQGKVTTFNPVRSPSRNEYRVTVLDLSQTTSF